MANMCANRIRFFDYDKGLLPAVRAQIEKGIRLYDSAATPFIVLDFDKALESACEEPQGGVLDNGPIFRYEDFGGQSISFETKWGPADDFCKKLSGLFPEVLFDLSYSETFPGGCIPSGELVFKEGQEVGSWHGHVFETNFDCIENYDPCLYKKYIGLTLPESANDIITRALEGLKDLDHLLNSKTFLNHPLRKYDSFRTKLMTDRVKNILLSFENNKIDFHGVFIDFDDLRFKRLREEQEKDWKQQQQRAESVPGLPDAEDLSDL